MYKLQQREQTFGFIFWVWVTRFKKCNNIYEQKSTMERNERKHYKKKYYAVKGIKMYQI